MGIRAALPPPPPPPPPPRDFVLIFSASMFVLMGFNMFGTRLQSLWIMFFLLEWGVKPNAGQNPFETVTIRHVTLTSVSAGFCQSTFSTDPCVVVSKRYTL